MYWGCPLLARGRPLSEPGRAPKVIDTKSLIQYCTFSMWRLACVSASDLCALCANRLLYLKKREWKRLRIWTGTMTHYLCTLVCSVRISQTFKFKIMTKDRTLNQKRDPLHSHLDLLALRPVSNPSQWKSVNSKQSGRFSLQGSQSGIASER